MNSPKTKAHIRREYRIQYQDPLQVKAGESVHPGRADDNYQGWLWCRSADGREGWMPVELLSRQESPAIVLGDYSAKELAVQPGDEVEVEEVRHGWALVRNVTGECGWIPESHIEM